MKNLALLLVLVAMATPKAYSAVTSKSAHGFCKDRNDRQYYQELLQKTENQLSFRNQGGLFGGGVCWWHSRFTRNALYLGVYRPDLRKPTREQAKDIIDDIRDGDRVVTIPGYSNLREFSLDFRREIQDELDSWQRFDGFIKQQWIVGLWGRTEVSADKLMSKMDDLYEYVAVQKNVAYQKLQMPSIVAHAWLVTDVHKTHNGYDLVVHDSNFSGTKTVPYKVGMTQFHYRSFGEYVPYTERKRELRGLKKVVRRFCR